MAALLPQTYALADWPDTASYKVRNGRPTTCLFMCVRRGWLVHRAAVLIEVDGIRLLGNNVGKHQDADEHDGHQPHDNYDGGWAAGFGNSLRHQFTSLDGSH